MSRQESEHEHVERLAEEFVERLRRGERPSLTEYAEKYPEHASEIRELFPAVAIMERLGPRAEELRDDAEVPFTSSARIPERLGEYRILREIGRGGMGVVYEAEQLSLGRHVAIKVLPLHAVMDGKLLKRFQHEARAAARLHHTNIVPVFGVGEHEGVHYYAMQFIHGQSLADVLEEIHRMREQAELPVSADGKSVEQAGAHSISHDLAQSLVSDKFPRAGERPADADAAPDAKGRELPRAVSPASGSAKSADSSQASTSTISRRSELTNRSRSGIAYYQSVARVGVQVADALAHAHSQGVVHRDIKPSNLLLDAHGIVWVTDFGLAKQEGEDLTQSGDIVGTLRYMAPERFHGASDWRSDVYGLGVTLYELLTLRPAFHASDRAQLLQRITRDEPVHPRKIDRRIPSDLETIVLKAIDKEPRRRYQQAAELVQDLRRFLDGEPIQARPTSAAEKVWKWMKRRPAAASFLSLLVLFASSMTALSWRLSVAYETVRQAQELSSARLIRSEKAEAATHREAERARLEAAKFEEINRFLLEMLASADPKKALGRDISVRELLDVASNRLETELEEQPEVRAALHDTIGWTYRNLGVLDAAEPHIRTAIEIRRGLGNAPTLELAAYLQHLADLIGSAGFAGSPEKSREALAAVREATAIRDSLLGPHHSTTVYSRSRLSQFEWYFGSPEASEAAIKKVVIGVGDEFPLPVAELEQRLAKIAELWSSGQREQALQFIRENVTPYQDKLKDPDLVIQGLQGLAGLSHIAKALDVAEPLRRVALEISHEYYGGEHPAVAASMYSLGATLYRQKDYPEAIELLERSLELRCKILGRKHPETVLTRGLLCSTLIAKGDNAAALPVRRELLDDLQSQLGEDDPQVLRAKENLAEVLFRLRKYAEVETLDRDVLRRRVDTLGSGHPDVLASKRRLGSTLSAQKKYDQAQALFQEAWAGYRESVGAEDLKTLQVMRLLADTMRAQEQYPEAATIYGQLLELHQRLKGANSPQVVPYLRDTADILWKCQRYSDGIVHARAAASVMEASQTPNSAQAATAYQSLAWWLAFCPDAEVRRPSEAVALAERAVRIDAKRPLNWQTLGIAQYAAGDADQAVEALGKSCQLNSGGAIMDFFMLCLAHSARGDSAAARGWYDKALTSWTKQKPRNPDLDRLRSEAERALGIRAEN